MFYSNRMESIVFGASGKGYPCRFLKVLVAKTLRYGVPGV